MNSVIASSACPACETHNLHETIEVESFPYGEDAESINAAVPVLTCSACNFVYTDERAEKARHAAVCKHLGLLSPEEILHIRKTVLGMSRDAFHAAYGLSSASVERWENGKLIQNESADTLIRALTEPATALLLDRRERVRFDAPALIEIDNVVFVRFPNLAKRRERAEDAIERSKAFDLRFQAR